MDDEVLSDSKKRILITGAAGKVGGALLPELERHYQLRLLDASPIPEATDVWVGDIQDGALLDQAMANLDTVVHLAADAEIGTSFAALLGANISGTYQLYEAARRNGVKRIVLASTSHTVEYDSPLRQAPTWKEYELYPTPLPLSFQTPPRPDSLYGVSKVFGEVLARYYADAFGISSVCLRLGSVTPDPGYLGKPRAWALWISSRDLGQLFRCAIEAAGVGCAIVYGCSANTRRWWDLGPARELIGFVPQDDSEALIPDWYGGGLVPPAPNYAMPWGERLAALPVSGEQGMLVWMGQSGFFLKLGDGMCVAIDPFLTEWPDRLEPPLLAAGDLPADLVLITHTHRDHLDVHALPIIAQTRSEARFVAPPTGCEKLEQLGLASERITRLCPGESCQIGNLTVTATHARHQDTAPDAQGYLIATRPGTLFHTGDSEYDPCLLDARAHRPDLLLVPINGCKGNMSGKQAARLAADLQARAVIPMHYGCLQPQVDLVDRFLAELGRVAPTVRPAVMELGAILKLPVKVP